MARQNLRKKNNKHARRLVARGGGNLISNRRSQVEIDVKKLSSRKRSEDYLKIEEDAQCIARCEIELLHFAVPPVSGWIQQGYCWEHDTHNWLQGALSFW